MAINLHSLLTKTKVTTTTEEKNLKQVRVGNMFLKVLQLRACGANVELISALVSSARSLTPCRSEASLSSTIYGHRNAPVCVPNCNYELCGGGGWGQCTFR